MDAAADRGSVDRAPVCNICTERMVWMGRMDSCRHLFCWEDISRWAQEQNTCPWCRKVFVRLQKIQVTEGEYEMSSFTELHFLVAPTIAEEVKVLPTRQRNVPGPSSEELLAYLEDPVADLYGHQVGSNAELLSAEAVQARALAAYVAQLQQLEQIKRQRAQLRLRFEGFLQRRRADLRRAAEERERGRQYHSKEGVAPRHGRWARAGAGPG